MFTVNKERKTFFLRLHSAVIHLNLKANLAVHGCGQASREASPAVLLKTPQQLCFSDVSSAPWVGMPTQCDVSYLSPPLEDTSSVSERKWQQQASPLSGVSSGLIVSCCVCQRNVFVFFVLMGWFIFQVRRNCKNRTGGKNVPVKFSMIRCQCLNFSFPCWIHLEVVQQPVLLTFLLDTTQLTTALKWQLWVSAVGLALSNLFSTSGLFQIILVAFRQFAWFFF